LSDGYVLARGVFSRDEIRALRSHASALVEPSPDRPAPPYVQTAFNAEGAVKLLEPATRA
jgi:hypothetical protein